MKAYEESKSVLALKADSGNGHAVFQKDCTPCHVFAGEGHIVGPDLTGIRNQPSDVILLHIVVPEYEIVPIYTCYNVETKEGRAFTGLLVTETPAAITCAWPRALSNRFPAPILPPSPPATSHSCSGNGESDEQTGFGRSHRIPQRRMNHPIRSRRHKEALIKNTKYQIPSSKSSLICGIGISLPCHMEPEGHNRSKETRGVESNNCCAGLSVLGTWDWDLGFSWRTWIWIF